MKHFDAKEVDRMLNSSEDEDTIAYWTVAVHDQEVGRAATTEKWTALLDSQFDAEDQASVGDDDVYGIPPELRTKVQLFAPIQLNRRWKAVDALVSFVGSPANYEIDGSARAFVGFWPMGNLSGAARLALATRPRRLVSLIRQSLSISPHFLFVAMVGYDYRDSAMSGPARKALERAGFLETTRN